MKTIITFIIGLSFLFLVVPAVLAQDSSPSGVALDDITENVKKRIQEVVKDRSFLENSNPSTAYLGNLQTITNNTLSILTPEGIRLASTSASTVFIRLPGNRTIGVNDLSIDGYVAAIGESVADKVLDTKKVISQETAPQPPANKSFYGSVISYDPAEFLLVAQNPLTNEQLTVLIGRKTTLNQWVTDGTKNVMKRTKSLPAGSPVMIVYNPEGAPDNGNLALDVLINPAP
jgi:hypothetical protein